MSYLLLIYGISLGLTLILELIVAFLLDYRTKEALWIVVLVNILTNPAAVFLHTAVGLPQIPIEILVVIIECYVYRKLLFSHPLRLSLTANGISWGLGLLLQML